MRNLLKVTSVGVLGLVPAALFGATVLKTPDVTVGRALQAYTSVTLPAPAPAGGVEVTVTSDDPKKALVSASADGAGSASIKLTVKKGFYNSPEFFVHGLADSGTVTYTAAASGLPEAKGKITLLPSTIAIVGPMRQASLATTPRGYIMKLTLVSATLDPSMNVLDEQQIAGGSSVTVHIDSSHPDVGHLGQSDLTLKGGESVAYTSFAPAAEGKTTLSLAFPKEFHAPANYSTFVATVHAPGISVADEMTVGKDLQVSALVCLGDPAPPSGLTVTLTSSDPSKLVLSAAADKLGTGAVTLQVPAGAATVPYFLQSLDDSGTVTYQATAPGYRTRVGHIVLAPSGLIVGFAQYGPPDEAAVLRRIGSHEERAFYASIETAKKTPVNLMVWSAYLDGGLAADITVQALRPGVTVTANLTSSDPSIGTVESPVTIPSGSSGVRALFTPLTPGQSIITIDTPAGFSRPKNAVVVPANVMK